MALHSWLFLFLLLCLLLLGSKISEVLHSWSNLVLSINVEVSLVQALLVSIFSIQFSSLFIEIPYLVVRSAVMQKSSTTTILSKSSFSAFIPDVYVCCDQTYEGSHGCGHFGKYLVIFGSFHSPVKCSSTFHVLLPISILLFRLLEGCIYHIANNIGG